jgi:hypothetical protein
METKCICVFRNGNRYHHGQCMAFHKVAAVGIVTNPDTLTTTEGGYLPPKKPYHRPTIKDIAFRAEGTFDMNTTPDNEKAVDAFEVDALEVILKHRAEEGISAVDVSATLVNILFAMATTQPNPAEATHQIKQALDNVCKTWYEAGKPDVLNGLITRCLLAKGVAPNETTESHDPGVTSPK